MESHLSIFSFVACFWCHNEEIIFILLLKVMNRHRFFSLRFRIGMIILVTNSFWNVRPVRYGLGRV